MAESAGRVKQGSLTNEDVLRSEIPWPAFMTAGIISKEQLEMMYLLDKQSLDTQISQFESVRPPCGLRVMLHPLVGRP